MKLPRRPLAAFSLVEVTLALGIMAFCLLAVFGLLPTGLNSDKAAIQQTAAAGMAVALAADLRQTPATAANATVAQSPQFFIAVPTLSGQGSVIHTRFLTDDGAWASSTPTTAPDPAAPDPNADPSQNPRYRATLVFTRKDTANTTDRMATAVRVLVTWPALADPSGTGLPVKFSGSFETMIALDRN